MNRKRTAVARACVVALAMAASACSSGRRGGPDAPTDRRGEIAHIVVFWLKQPGDADGRRRVIEASESFRSVPGVVSVEAGEMVPSPRPNVDKTYDVAIVMWFRDGEALEQYQTSPVHKAMLAQVGPLVERTVVYDFSRAGPK